MAKRKKFTEIRGYLNENEGLKLQELAKDKDVLDIGTFFGRSAICFAEVAKSVVTVDTFCGGIVNNQVQEPKMVTYDDFLTNIAGYKNITHYVGRSDEILPLLEGPFDVIFIDGSHRYEDVRSDAKLSLPLLKEDGIIIFHDYFDEYLTPGVKQAVTELFKSIDGSFERCFVWVKASNVR